MSINVVILSERFPTTSQLRLAVSCVSHSITVTDQDLPARSNPKYRQSVTDADVILIAVPAGIDDSRRILTAVRPQTNARIVAVSVAESPQQILQVLHAGADAFIDEAGDLQRQVKAELDRVVQQMQETASPPEGSLIAVTGAVGGAGATLAATNLAVMLSGADQPCGLIDLSGGFGELAAHFGLEPRHTLSELCSNSEFLDLEMLKKSITEHSSGVQLIASAAVMSEWEFGSNESTRRVVEASCRLLPNVVIDLNRRAPFSQELLAHCDAIVLMTRLDFPTACSTQRLLETWAEQGIVEDRTIVVANRCQRKGELSVRMVESMLGRRIACRIKDEAASANHSMNCGNPAVFESPKSTLAKDLRKLERFVVACVAGSDPTTNTELKNERRSPKSVPALLKRVAAAFF